MDDFLMLASGGFGGAAIVSLAGLVIRAYPDLQVWAYFFAGISAIALGCLLALKNPQITLWCGVVVFFGILGVILAGV